MPNTPIKCNSYLIVLEGDELVISQSGHQSIRRDRTPVVKEECR